MCLKWPIVIGSPFHALYANKYLFAEPDLFSLQIIFLNSMYKHNPGAIWDWTHTMQFLFYEKVTLIWITSRLIFGSYS